MRIKFSTYDGIAWIAFGDAIDHVDLMLMHHIHEASQSSRMVRLAEPGGFYVWLDHSKIMSDMPYLKIKMRQMRNRLKKLQDINLLEKKVIFCGVQNQRRSFYRPSQTYLDMIDVYIDASGNMTSTLLDKLKNDAPVVQSVAPRVVQSIAVNSKLIDSKLIKERERGSEKNENTPPSDIKSQKEDCSGQSPSPHTKKCLDKCQERSVNECGEGSHMRKAKKHAQKPKFTSSHQSTLIPELGNNENITSPSQPLQNNLTKQQTKANARLAQHSPKAKQEDCADAPLQICDDLMFHLKRESKRADLDLVEWIRETVRPTQKKLDTWIYEYEESFIAMCARSALEWLLQEGKKKKRYDMFLSRWMTAEFKKDPQRYRKEHYSDIEE